MLTSAAGSVGAVLIQNTCAVQVFACLILFLLFCTYIPLQEDQHLLSLYYKEKKHL